MRPVIKSCRLFLEPENGFNKKRSVPVCFVKSIFLLLSMPVLFLNACAPAIPLDKLPPVGSISSQPAEVTEILERGRTYYIQQCSGCHRHIWPSEYTPRQWKLILKDHWGRVYLTEEEYEKLKTYVLLVSQIANEKTIKD